MIATQPTLTSQQIVTLTRELVAYQDQLAAIHELARKFSGQLDLEAATRALLETVVRAVPVREAAVWLDLPEESTAIFSASNVVISDELLREGLAQVQQHGDYLLQNNNAPGSILPSGIKNWLLLPLNVRGQMMGLLALIDKQNNDFLVPDVKLCQALTTQLCMQIENTLWHNERVVQASLEAQLSLAEEVQKCLLPQKLPQIPGLDVWVSSNPLHQVGGDFYDFIFSRHSPPLMSVGDVCGKGVAAAMLMAMTRTTLRNAEKFLPQCNPGCLVEHTNIAMYDDYTEVGMFASLFVGQYFPDEGLLRYANAGHAPVIYCPKNSEARLLPAGNASIGMLSQAEIIESTVPFGPGDVLVVASDGLSEAMNQQDEMFGFERLLETISRCAGQNVETIGAVIQAVVTTFRGQQPPSDDQTLVVLKGRSS